ncbi:hypothetical protein Tco_1265327 [Tanacetum coccineum]
MYETNQTIIPSPSRLKGYYCEEKKGSYGPQFSEAYPETSHIDNSIPRKEKDLGSFTLPCFINNVCFDNALVDLGASTKSARRIPDKGDLRDYWIRISSAGDFLGTTPSYTFIRDPMLRLCHRLIACTIIGRSQAPKKVTVTSLFYLRGMDVGSVNVPYLLARYLRLFASGGKQGALISGGQYVARLAEHFGLLTEERL